MPTLRSYGLAAAAESGQENAECPVCRGDYKRCRLEICPYLKDVRELLRRIKSSRTVFGSSPPSTFIGSWGYPRVLAGPLVPPLQADTSLLEQYDKWLEIPLEELVAMRVSLVRGKWPTSVIDARNPDKILATLHELAMAKNPIDVELELEKEPTLHPNFLVRASPTGPSAPMRRAIIAENPRIPKSVEKVVYDVDLRAYEAIDHLYSSGIREQYIVRLLSMGLLGSKRWRKLVPTEWSITAVDDQLGKKFRSEIKRYPWINEIRLFSHFAHFNRVTALMIPGPWMFEVFEAWHKQNIIKIYYDAELPGDVDRYPENVGGAYHALRLPVLEKLRDERRQASVIVVAEVYEGWIPLGVWRFREICRAALRHPPLKLENLSEAFKALEGVVGLSSSTLVTQSRILKFHLQQAKLTDFPESPV
ncbi:MAG: hypothetical protein N3F65_03525 [Nitrososphaeria archaeon]|nr:hypothetical protein [Nitrososphaeria archaeon]